MCSLTIVNCSIQPTWAMWLATFLVWRVSSASGSQMALPIALQGWNLDPPLHREDRRIVSSCTSLVLAKAFRNPFVCTLCLAGLAVDNTFHKITIENIHYHAIQEILPRCWK